MSHASEEQRDLHSRGGGDDPGGEHPGALLGVIAGQGGGPLLTRQLQYLHRGVVVVQDRALGCLADQLLMHGGEHLRRGLDQVPLRGRREWDAQRLLQPLDAVEGQACSILEQAHHAHCGRVVLVAPDARGRLGGVDLAAEVASQPIALVHPRPQRGHPRDPHQQRRLLERIDLAVLTARAVIAPLEPGVGNRHVLGPGEGSSTVATMAGPTRSIGAGTCGDSAVAGLGGGAALSPTEHLLGLLRARSKQHLPQPFEAGVLRSQLRAQERDDAGRGVQCIHRRLELAVLLGAQGRLGALDDGGELEHIELDRRGQRRSAVRLAAPLATHAARSQLRKSAASGRPSTSLMARFIRCVRSSLPRPVVRPRCIQFAAR